MSKFVKLVQNNARILIDGVDTILFDCDGVLYRGQDVIKGTPEVVKKLTDLGKKIFYVTNNSSKSRKQVSDKLSKMNFPVTENQIITSGFVASKYLKKKILKNEKIFLIGDKGLKDELTGHGLQVLLPEEQLEGKTNTEKLLNYKVDPNVAWVVVGLDEYLTYLKMGQASIYLLSKDHKCQFLATNKDSSYPAPNELILPGAGSCVAMLETAVGRKVDVDCGKPQKIMADVIRDEFKVDLNKCVMVGDRLDTDIKFGNTNKMKTLLVLTGLMDENQLIQLKHKAHPQPTNQSQVDNLDPLLAPDFYLESLADLFKFL